MQKPSCSKMLKFTSAMTFLRLLCFLLALDVAIGAEDKKTEKVAVVAAADSTAQAARKVPSKTFNDNIPSKLK